MQKGFKFKKFLVFVVTWCIIFALYAAVIGRRDLIPPIFYVGLPLGIAAALAMGYSGFIPWMKKRRVTMLIPYYILIFSIIFILFRGEVMGALPLIFVLAFIIGMRLKWLLTGRGGQTTPPQP